MKEVAKQAKEKKRTKDFIENAIEKSKYDLEFLRDSQENLKNLCHNLWGIKRDTKRFDLDWVFVGSGMEGSGKSTLSLQELFLLDPKFSFKKQSAANLLDFIKVSKKNMNNPFKVIFIDEIADLAFSRDSMTVANRILVKLFISNRSFRHYYFMNVPSFFWLDNYIRNFRVKTMNYSFLNFRFPEKRFFHFYSRRRYKNLIMNRNKAEPYMLDPDRLKTQFKPNFTEQFFPIPKNNEMWQEYIKNKRKFQMDLLKDAEDEALKLEEREKIGFHEKMDMSEFIVWLSRYRIQKSNMMYINQRSAAKEAGTRKQNINNLIERAITNGWLEYINRSKYKLTKKSIDVLDRGGEKYSTE